MPLSAGFLEMWMNKERRAENSVAGVGGIGGPGRWTVPFVGNDSDVVLRSGLRRAADMLGNGVDVLIAAVVGFWGSASVGSGHWSTSSRNGLQKYRAWRIELA